MILSVDNGSRYTDRLLDYLCTLNVNFETQQPHKVDTDKLHIYSSFILSGRRSNNNHTNKINSQIIHFAITHNRPLLGICYGAEMLALTMGGTIRRMQQSVYGDMQVQVTQSNPLCMHDISVFESHSYEISAIPPPLTSVGSSATCHNEIIRYGDTMVFGVQFHPEMSSDGLSLVKQFLSIEQF